MYPSKYSHLDVTSFNQQFSTFVHNPSTKLLESNFGKHPLITGTVYNSWISCLVRWRGKSFSFREIFFFYWLIKTKCRSRFFSRYGTAKLRIALNSYTKFYRQIFYEYGDGFEIWMMITTYSMFDAFSHLEKRRAQNST